MRFVNNRLLPSLTARFPSHLFPVSGEGSYSVDGHLGPGEFFELVYPTSPTPKDSSGSILSCPIHSPWRAELQVPPISRALAIFIPPPSTPCRSPPVPCQPYESIPRPSPFAGLFEGTLGPHPPSQPVNHECEPCRTLLSAPLSPPF